MGTDIYVVWEKKDKETGKWEAMSIEHEEYPHRFYHAFSLLADVRNGFGFAMYDTGDRIIPIDSPRGFPEGISSEVSVDFYDLYDQTYFNYKDFIDYEWSRIATLRGVIRFRDWLNYRNHKGENPAKFGIQVYTFLMGKKVIKFTDKEAEEVFTKLTEEQISLIKQEIESGYTVEGFGPLKNPKTGDVSDATVVVEYKESYTDLMYDYIDKYFIKVFEKYSEEKDHSDLRVVIAFSE